MFHHAYDGYLKYAYPLDELRPLTCDGHDTWGRFEFAIFSSTLCVYIVTYELFEVLFTVLVIVAICEIVCVGCFT